MPPKTPKKPEKKAAAGKAQAHATIRSAPKPSRAQRTDGVEAAQSLRFPIVGLGASAGGLAALEEFLTSMPPESGMAFVVVTHQHAGHKTLMAELLGRKTPMPVVEIAAPTPVQPNRVYTVRPGYNLAILNGVLHPMEASTLGPIHLPVDYFFRSLAQDQKERAVAIVLSGTGTDGSLGVKEIKAALGLVLVQEEKNAQYSAMPLSAAATGCADYVLPAAEMPKQLVAYASGLRPARAVTGTEEDEAPAPEGLQKVFLLLRGRTGHDFSLYKTNTMRRRIERRINVHHLASFKDYVRFLQTNPAEIDLLFKELLIGVTSFFRDRDAFEALEQMLMKILASKPNKAVVRAWVAGCSTGEEAYSIAILVRECLEKLNRPLDVQIFATDLDVDAIDSARNGVFPAGIANDVSAARLSRFFTREEETFRIKKEIREMMVFAVQNVISDPPFTKLDLLSCRNLLIYLDTSLQKRLIPIFHYSLKPGGVLFLGPSESIGEYGTLFEPIDKKWKIFGRKDVPYSTYTTEFAARAVPTDGGARPATFARGRPDGGIGQAADRLLLREIVPPSVLVHERGDVVHVHGRTGLFLEPAQGPQGTANIFNMARPGIELELASGMRQVATLKKMVRRTVKVPSNGGFVSAELCIRPVVEPESLRGLFLVSFERAHVAAPEPAATAAPKGKATDRSAQLEMELRRTKETHQGTVEELETANEELKSTNEELQSANEELQSTNEELETSKEEMQSLNEELQTVNAEVQAKVEELSRASDDMKNLLNATDIATVFVDNDLRIKRFTETAKSVIRLIPTDIGRDIGDLVSTLRYDRLVEDARDVLRRLVPKEMEIRGESETWYLMRILPYRTTDNVIDGLVMTFVDISKARVLQEDQRRLLSALGRSPTAVFAQDKTLRYMWSPTPLLGRPPRDILGKTDADLFGAKEGKELAAIKKQALETLAPARRAVQLKVDGAARTFDLFVEPLRGTDGQVLGVSCVMTDMTKPGSEG